ncbi:MAG TPA: glycosyltransferase [Chloroflexia bacterium]|nr:glycosyltransferase [Chloroflexia bacterium]
MILTPLLGYALLVLAVTVVLLGIVLVNLAILPTPGPGPRARDGRVAVLVPARDEEMNIEACVRGLLAQDYPDMEIWVFDDASTDRTGEIAERLAGEPRDDGPVLYVVRGSGDPPPGWMGKPYACHRLYNAMRERSCPEYVLFTDADVRFEPEAVSAAVDIAVRERSGLLSIFPRQEIGSWGERLVVPLMMHWTGFTLLPLPTAHAVRTGPAFAAANGQFMLFTREAYEACDGHRAVRDSILEDVVLARAVKRAKHRTILADTGPLLHTRMYRSAGEVWRGYSKNAFAFFGYSSVLLVLGAAALLALYVFPPVLAVWAFLAGEAAAAWAFAGAYGAAVAARIALSVRFSYPVLDSLLHPVGMLCLVAIMFNSMVWGLTGRGAWKGRTIARTDSA